MIQRGMSFHRKYPILSESVNGLTERKSLEQKCKDKRNGEEEGSGER